MPDDCSPSRSPPTQNSVFDVIDATVVGTGGEMPDDCSPSRSPPTQNSVFDVIDAAVVGTGDPSLEISSSFRQDSPQDGESHIQQLDMDLCQLRKSIQELHSQLIKLDDQEADLSHELYQLHSVIDNERCRDAVKKLVVLLEQLTDLEGQESGLESNLLVCEEEISNLSRTKCGSIDMDNCLIDSSNKLNLLKRELATKMRAMLSLKCQLDDVPVHTELIQYERRFSELYAQIQEKHGLTRKHYDTYNALLEIKELMLKEFSLLNSIDLQFKDAMITPSGRTKLLDSMEVIVKGTKHKLEKAKLDLLAELQLCDSLKEKHTVAIAELHHFSDLLKTFQDACTKYERLQELALK